MSVGGSVAITGRNAAGSPCRAGSVVSSENGAAAGGGTPPALPVRRGARPGSSSSSASARLRDPAVMSISRCSAVSRLTTSAAVCGRVSASRASSCAISDDSDDGTVPGCS